MLLDKVKYTLKRVNNIIWPCMEADKNDKVD